MRNAKRCLCRDWYGGLWICLLLLGGPTWSAVWYVKSDGDDSRDGTSWSRAVASIQLALDRAAAGDAVWIAGGDYDATTWRLVEAEAEWELSFRLRDGVDIFGGFAGSESSPDERALAAAVADAEPRAWDFATPSVLTIPAHASGSVLKADVDTFSRETVIDGVVICGGLAIGGGLDGFGGGALLPGKAVLRRSVISGNWARFGGGVAMLGDSVLQQCLVTANEVLPDGWGGVGGGVYAVDDQAQIDNCLIADNAVADRGIQQGGGVYLLGGATLSHCTIVGNYAPMAGSGVCAPAAAARVVNSLVWGNSGASEQLYAPGGAISHSGVAGSRPAGSQLIPLAAANCGNNGPEVNDSANHCYYVCFRDPLRGDYRLGAGSYAINRGDNAAAGDKDAGLAERVCCRQTDLGAFESAQRGNLCVDFQVEMPCVYGREALVTPGMGVCTPAGVLTTCLGEEGRVTWRRDASSRDIARWQRAGMTFLELAIAVAGVEADAWNPAACCREILVNPRKLVIAADDIEHSYGAAMPALTWDLLAGSVVADDSITGAPACALGTALGRSYTITQGTLAVADGRDGFNYAIEFLPGNLLYRKAAAGLSLAADSCSYRAAPVSPQVLTEPAGLALELTYAGCDGTDYPASSTAPVAAGTYSLTVTVKDEHYSGSLLAEFTIAPAVLTVTVHDQTRLYGRENPPLTMSISGFFGLDGLADIVPPTLSTPARQDSPVVAGGYPIVAAGGTAANYRFSIVPGVLRVTPAGLQARDVVVGAMTYGEPLSRCSLEAVVGAAGAGPLVPGHAVWDEPLALLPAGTHRRTWTYSPDDGSNYQSLTGESTVVVQRRPVSVRAGAVQKLYGETDPSLSYVIHAGSVMSGDAFCGALSRRPGENAGDYDILQGSLSLSANYLLSYTEAPLTILPRPIAVTALDASKVFGAADPGFEYVVSPVDGLLPGDAFSGALSREAGEDAGRYAITQGSLVLSQNYQLSFTGGALTIATAGLVLHGAVTTQPINYGDAMRRSTITGEVRHNVTGEIVPGHFAWLYPDFEPMSGTVVKPWVFMPDSADSYTPLTGTATVTVHTLCLEVRLCNPAPSRIYGNPNPSMELEYTGFNEPETVLALTVKATVSCDATKDSPVGAYPVTISGARLVNYTFRYYNDTLTVLPAPPKGLVSVTASSSVYGVALKDVPLTGSFGHPTYGTAVPGQLSWELPGETVLPAGEHWLGWLFTPASSNYTTQRGEALLRIAKAPLTVTADDQWKWQGQANPVLTLSYVGLVNGDDVLSPGLFDVSPQAQSAADTSSHAGDYVISAGGGVAVNYHLLYTYGTLTVKPAIPQFRVLAEPIVFYGERPLHHPPQCEVRHPFTGELVDGYFGACSVDRFLPVGVHDITWYFYPTLPGICAVGNLTIATNIRPRQLRITALDTGKDCGDADGPLQWVFADDSMTLHNLDQVSGALLRQAGEAPGDYAIQQGTLTAGANYTIDFTSGVFSIAPRRLTLQAVSASKVYGDKDPALRVNVVAGSLLAGDAISGQPQRDPGEYVGNYAIRVGSLSLPDSYSWEFVAGSLDITARALTIGAVAAAKVYGAPEPEVTWQLTSGSLVAGDQVTGTLSRTPGENVGNYPILRHTLTAGGNYDLTYVGASLVISQRRLGVIAHNKKKMINQPDPELTFELATGSTLVSGDAWTGSLTWSGLYSVGTYPIQQGGLALNGNYLVDFTPGTMTVVASRPVLVGQVTASDIVYGDKLGASLLSAHFVHPLTMKALPGTLCWDNPDMLFQASVPSPRYKFTPDPETDVLESYASVTAVRVLRRRLKIVGDRIEKSYGDLTPALTYQIVEGALLPQDSLTGALSYSGPTAVGEYEISQGNLSAPASYELEYVAGVLVIKPRLLLIQAYDCSKTAGKLDPSLKYFLVSGSYLYGQYPTGALVRDPGESPGSYVIRQGTLRPPANHGIDFIEGSLTILPATRGEMSTGSADAGWDQADAVGLPAGHDRSLLAGRPAGVLPSAVLVPMVGVDAGQGAMPAVLAAFAADSVFTRLEDALPAMAAGGVIHVLPGVYPEPVTGAWLIDKPLTICALGDGRGGEAFFLGTMVIGGAAARGVQLSHLSLLSAAGQPALVVVAGASQIALTDNTLVGGTHALRADGTQALYLFGNQLSSAGSCLDLGEDVAQIKALDNIYHGGDAAAAAGEEKAGIPPGER